MLLDLQSETREFDADLARLKMRAMRMFAKRNRGGGRVIADVRTRGRDRPWGDDVITAPETRARRYRVFQNAVFVVGRGI